MVKETSVNIITESYDIRKHTLSSDTRYYINVVSIREDGSESIDMKYNSTDKEEDANVLYDFVVKHHGVNRYEETVKESKINLN